MFTSLAFFLGAQGISIPLGKPPRVIEQPRSPIESAGPRWALECKGADGIAAWTKPAPPVRIHANTYLVGTCGISSILIVGSDGDVLIDGGPEEAADLIADNIRALGYRLTDIKYLLNSHEHFDHAGGLAKLQRLTGAQLVASSAQAEVLNSGVPAKDDPQFSVLKPFPAAHVDHLFTNGQMVRIGNVAVTAAATPGHTPGALTWHWGSCDGGVCRQIVYADSLTPVSDDKYRFSDHPAYVSAFRASIAAVAALDCDILLTPHPGASDMPNRLALGKPLLDPDACKNYAAARTKDLDDRLAKEAGAQPTPKP
jgi:metallo-beta-lactamase class B